MDEELGYWMLEESKEVSITYDYYLEEYGVKVNRKSSEEIKLMSFIVNPYIGDELGLSLYAGTEFLWEDSQTYTNWCITFLPYFEWDTVTGEGTQKVAIAFLFDVEDIDGSVPFEVYFNNIKLESSPNYLYEAWHGLDKVEIDVHTFRYIDSIMDSYFPIDEYWLENSAYKSKYLNELFTRDIQTIEMVYVKEFINSFTIVVNGQEFKFSNDTYENTCKDIVKVEE